VLPQPQAQPPQYTQYAPPPGPPPVTDTSVTPTHQIAPTLQTLSVPSPTAAAVAPSSPTKLTDYYNMNAMPSGYQPQVVNQQMYTSANSQVQHTSGTPSAYAVGTVDPTMVIPLALTQVKY
jgi:hypothetical protein